MACTVSRTKIGRLFVWGHTKSLVYATPIQNIEILREKIIETAEEMRQTFSSRVTVSEISKRDDTTINTCPHDKYLS